MGLSGLKSFGFPSDPSVISGAAFQGYDQAQAQQQQAVQLALQWLQLEELKRGMANRARARSLFPLVVGGQPEQATVEAGAVPPITTSPVPSIAQAVGGGGAGIEDVTSLGAPRPNDIPGIPARREQISGFTPRSMAEAIGGPANLATVMTDPEGSKLLGDMGMESQADFEKRRRRADAKVKMEQAFDEAAQAADAGDRVAYERALVRAHGFQADFVDDKDRAQALQKRTEASDRLATVVRKQKEHDPELQELSQAMRKFNENPGDPAAWAHLWELSTRVKDPDNQRIVERWLPQAEKEFQQQAAQGRDQKAFGTIMQALQAKKRERRARMVSLSPDELQQIALEVQMEHPQEFARADYLLATTRGTVPFAFAQMLHPELQGSKDWQTLQLIRAEHPEWTDAQVNAEFSMLRGKGTPAEQQSRIHLNEARQFGAQWKAKFDAGDRSKDTLQGLSLAQKRFQDALTALPASNYTEPEKKEQGAILKEEIAEVQRRIKAFQSQPGTAAVGTPPAPPTKPSARGDDLYTRAKDLWRRDTNPQKGDFDADDTVAEKYFNQARRQPAGGTP